MNTYPKPFLLIFSVFSFLFFSCGNKVKNPVTKATADKTKPEVQVIKKPKEPVRRDRSITIENSFNNMFLDSVAITRFLNKRTLTAEEKQQVLDFYTIRNYEYAWFDSTGMNEQALNFMSANRSYISLLNRKELQNDSLVNNFNQVLEDSAKYDAKKPIVFTTELQLTAQFFSYAKQAYHTDANEVVDLNWFVPRKKIDIPAYIEQLNTGKKTDAFEPATPQYHQLKETLLKYAAIEKSGGWDTTLRPGAKAYRMGQKSTTIAAIKKRLHLSGDLPQADTTTLFDAALVTAVNRFAHRMGFSEDSAVGPNLLTELNRPVSWRIQQIIINMERLRWAPAHLPEHYISVNIPDYKLQVYENSKPAWNMDIVVGNAQHGTIVFSSNLKYVVFSPYWNVPYSIVKNEMGKTARYFSRRNMEVVGHYSNGLPMVRQKPGGANALGGVKFLFPNEYDIYFHDSPAKSLFSRDKRAFSHGCIRLAEPAKMAAYLLRHDTAWSADSIHAAMHLKKELKVTLPETIPVFISYYTAWVDDAGLPNFRPDIYRHDREMAGRLFAKNK